MARRAPKAVADRAKVLEELVKAVASLREDVAKQARSLAAAIRDGVDYVPWRLKA